MYQVAFALASVYQWVEGWVQVYALEAEFVLLAMVALMVLLNEVVESGIAAPSEVVDVQVVL